MTFDPNGTYHVAWDYSAFPVWVQTNDSGAAHATITEQLELALQDWSNRVSDAMWGPNGPDAPGWDGPGDEVLAPLDAEGANLAAQLREALGSAATIEYVGIMGSAP